MIINTITKNGKKFTAITTSKGTVEFYDNGKGLSVSVGDNEDIAINNNTYKFNEDTKQYEKNKGTAITEDVDNANWVELVLFIGGILIFILFTK